MSEAGPRDPELSRCPDCGDALRCGLRLGDERCWCMDHPPLEPDPTLPGDACLCERCLRRRLAAQAGGEREPA